jgi:hypothetical protein
MLTDRRRFIAERRNEQSPRLAEWYVSALTVVQERHLQLRWPCSGIFAGTL